MMWTAIAVIANFPYRTGVDTEEDINGVPGVEIEWETSSLTLFVFFVDFFGGAFMFAFEYWTFARPTVQVAPWLWKFRAAAYFILALPGFLSSSRLMPPILPSIFYTLTSIVNVGSLFSQLPTEKEWAWPWFGSKSEKKKVEEAGGKYDTFGGFLRSCCSLKGITAKFEKGQLPRLIFLTWYTCLNIALGVHAYVRHGSSEKGKALRGDEFYACIEGDDGEITAIRPVAVTSSVDVDCPNGNEPVLIPANEVLQDVGFGWAGYPVAKAFGQLLNLNCAMLILPVIRSLVRILHDLTSINGPPCLRWIAFVFPLDKNIVWHKAVAKYFLLTSVFMHATLHYWNYSRAMYYSAVLKEDVYADSPITMAWSTSYGGFGLTGEIIMISMFIIYSGAHDKVKRSHYETFWFTHHFFIVFFVALYFHGSVFWQWGLITIVPYVIDRVIIRGFVRGGKRMPLANIFFWGKAPDVVTLQFDNRPDDRGMRAMYYMEGHYLYLQCPTIDGSDKRLGLLKEWHPFTISSAPDEPVLEVNIRVMPSPHAWTHKMAKYLALLDPHNTGHVEMRTRNPNTGAVSLGKVIGPNGKPFFRVDGPHGAPSQHVFCYNTALVVGAGIGVTPCASIMKGVVNFRWKKGFSPNNLHFYWVARLSDLTSFKWLLVMLPELKAAELAHNDFYGGDRARCKELMKQIDKLKSELPSSSATPKKPAALPKGWAESRTPAGQLYYFNEGTGQTSWLHPGDVEGGGGDGAEARLRQLQAALREASANSRSLTITLFLTGAKAKDLEPKVNAEPGSLDDLINALLNSRDPTTGTAPPPASPPAAPHAGHLFAQASCTSTSRREGPTGRTSSSRSLRATAARTSASSSAARP